jgi:hypothetical protein
MPLLRNAMGRLYCGGAKGRNGQMCILTACTVASHRVKLWDVVAKDSPSGIISLCISCTLVGGSSITTAVFGKPTIPSEKLSPTIAAMGRGRPIVDWKILFPVSGEPTRDHDGGSQRVGGTDLAVVSNGFADASEG